MPPDIDLDKIFCMNSKKYRIEKLLLKAITMVESSMDLRAFRHEPLFWQNYLANHPDWMDRDPQEVSSSYGLMQLMFTTAWMLGYRGDGEGLYDPVVNVELGAKLLRQLLDGAGQPAMAGIRQVDIALARYNGGATRNPDADGKLRNAAYVSKVWKAYADLVKTENNCA